MDCERRLRIVRIPANVILGWLESSSQKWIGSDFVAIPTVDLPADCKVLSVTHDLFSNDLLFRVQSESFSEVKNGEQIPQHEPSLDFRTVALHPDEKKYRRVAVNGDADEPVIR